ncbi:MAG: preprotein translocase subunit SecE [Candidatus Omnitrophica bacterium]|nr:preprotein translocase subunit SecE [Candidatus Omnitrophota bacterium]MCM8826984.1 preprotein translocase subunit SecE [Candidatus Omnitrophota bacterium]
MGIVRVIKKIPIFLKEVRLELKKVSWPGREDLISASVLVIVVISILTLYITIIDVGLSKLIELFLK